ncbi:MAG: glycosyltransferase family 4 protein, partial [Acidobacteriota bacterium]|nr:glycosyltransferase family 4 protein [Acidobacteriota bacterium]
MSDSGRPVVMVFSDYYLPGYKSGGGMRTIVNMVDRLGDKYDFRIVTRDHDGKADHEPYENVEIDGWNEIGAARVFYISKANIGIRKLKKLIWEVSPDIVYTNSLLSTIAIYVLKMRKLGLIPDVPFVIAPCGELSTGALRLKRSKKKLFFNYAKVIRLYKDIIWKASTDLEADEVRVLNPKNAKILVAPDLPPETIYGDYRVDDKPLKEPGSVKFVFVSRFEPKKNIKWLLPLLSKLSGNVRLDIVGPIQDQDYFLETKKEIAQLPENVVVEFVGPVLHEDVCPTISGYHFFVCPTLGENFGHIFLESMAAGTPLIISDRTPWKELRKKGLGWEIPLESPEEWQNVLRQCVDMRDKEFRELALRSRAFVTDWLREPHLDEKTERVLDFALDSA